MAQKKSLFQATFNFDYAIKLKRDTFKQSNC
jgi:hypothetical protein